MGPCGRGRPRWGTIWRTTPPSKRYGGGKRFVSSSVFAQRTLNLFAAGATYCCLGYCITRGISLRRQATIFRLRGAARCGRSASHQAIGFPPIPDSSSACAVTRLLAPPALLYSSSRVKELYFWLSDQHSGRKTFKTLQLKFVQLAADHPERRAMYRLLHGIVGRYIGKSDEAPLPSAIAYRAYQRLLQLLAEPDSAVEPARQLGDLNRLAALNLARCARDIFRRAVSSNGPAMCAVEQMELFNSTRIGARGMRENPP